MIKFSKKYKVLFELLEGKHPEVDTVILTGGRGSAKSFVIAVFSLLALAQHLWNVLYTRFTNVSIVDSIKPEVDSKIELLGLENYVNSTTSHIERGENRIAFKGIKTGSKQQTANLKSLFGFNCFVVDEAEELPDYETYEKVFLSIRSKDKRNITILILNPASVHHWIYRHFFTGRNVEGGSNCIKDNVMYIHTSYLDVPKEYLASNIIQYYQQLKLSDPKKYEQVVMGGWTEAVEGRVFNDWKRNTHKDFLQIKLPSFYAVDWGKNHKFGIVELKYDSYKNILYCHQRNYKSENELLAELTSKELEYIKDNGGIIIHTFTKLGIPKDSYIVCDSANPDNIILARNYGWEYAYGIDKPKGSVMAGITLLHSTEVIYTEESDGIDLEFKNYSYANDRLGVVDDEVIKAYDDCFVADTLITTNKGLVKIIDVKEGDSVLTSKGYKKVIHKFNNGLKQIKDYSIQFDTFSVSLSSTDNHLIKTVSGWEEISKLESGMMVYHTKHLTEKHINCTLAEDILNNINTTCTTKYGNFITESEIKDFTYITLTGTHSIIKSKTLKKLRRKRIQQITVGIDLKIIQNGLKSSMLKELKKQKNGIDPQKELNNTGNRRLKAILDNKHMGKGNAKYVNRLSCQKRRKRINIVQINANQKIGETKGLTTLKKNVSIAEQNLKQINIQKLQLVGVESKNTRYELTYDLMVDECHEFFANGILVHNCIDPIRYGRRHAEKFYNSN